MIGLILDVAFTAVKVTVKVCFNVCKYVIKGTTACAKTGYRFCKDLNYRYNKMIENTRMKYENNKKSNYHNKAHTTKTKDNTHDMDFF